MSLATVRAAIATQLEAQLDGQGYHVYPFNRGAIVTPALIVLPAPIEYDAAMQRGVHRVGFMVRLLVGSPEIEAEQRIIDAAMEPTGAASVPAALTADRTFAGTAHDSTVATCSGYITYTHDGKPPRLGCEWPVAVMMGAA